MSAGGSRDGPDEFDECSCAYLVVGFAECWRQNDSYVGASLDEVEICLSIVN